MALDTKEDDKKSGVASDIQDPVVEELHKQAERLGMLYLDKFPKVKKDALGVISEELAKKYKMAAFEKNGNSVKICMVDPGNFEALNILRFISENSGVELEIYVTAEKFFAEILRQYGANAEKVIADAVKSLKEDRDFEGNVVDSKDLAKTEGENIQDAPVTKLLSVIIKHAIEGKASDIHIEPVDKEYRVRFRVDGVLHSSLVAPKEVGRAVVSRIKILSNLKIDEKRKPQDGRFKIMEDGKSVDFRVSTFPVVDGEKVVMRLLDKNDKEVGIESLGLIGKSREILERNIMSPYGIILLTGPTGSGKSTTLYSFLQILNGEDRNIVTLEDPVEYSIEGINQSQVKPEIGYTFANGLRSILRQDPNVIMVGEIRDGETAELTIHAALTGHLVFSTLHTNSSIGAIPRLVDMGIEAFLLSSSLQVVAAQRLVRRICEKCKEEMHIPAAMIHNVKEELGKMDVREIKKYKVDMGREGGLKFYHGKGCDACAETGYKGRVAIYEALEVDDELKEIISDKEGNETHIEEYALKSGMVTIRQDGILKALLGMTTLSEVERVTKGSLSVGGDTDDDKG
ncbi:MAG TPA: hypothetical protein DCX32_01215 [Candidatus Moranbacteria bacterium]|nr:MAG: Type IV pilus assembly protein PilB [Candidatus Moranbacteria bacterium GW2011_GWC2_45_10]KKT94810.1 MAG: type IV pilus assembly protein PilB, type IV pilus assembly protein PilB [Parcubacteria group bacterium GW2011_GWC1_45_14]HAV11148.1 hypothetical protein [Candidatus Moranbacteria bacterium]